MEEEEEELVEVVVLRAEAREMVLERARMARDSRSFCCWDRPRSYHAWAFEGSRRTAASAWRTVWEKDVTR